MSVLDHVENIPNTPEEHASLHLAGGLSNHGYQCGILWGGVLYAGSEAYRQHGTGPTAVTTAMLGGQRATDLFRDVTKNRIECRQITGLDLAGKIRLSGQAMKFLIRGGPVYCVRMLVNYGHALDREIPNYHLAIETPEDGPISCTALLAQQAGASEMHQVMAAGLAGGIGLSGSVCGALGAAAWITAMNRRDDPAMNKLPHPRINEIIDEFSQETGGKLACRDIVGRQFEDVKDHATHIREDGCAEIIASLAAATSR